MNKKGLDSDYFSDSSSTSSIGNISSSDNNNDIFITPYLEHQSTWFQTEGGLDLLEYIKNMLRLARDNLPCNVESDTTRAILVPHAGIRYSGLCAASAYLELTNRTRPIKNIILLCTHHNPINAIESKTSNRKQMLDIFAPTFSKITTMNSKRSLAVDTDFITKIKHLVQQDRTGDLFRQEHAFFNQLPFLETVAPDAKICPLLIGNIIGTNASFKTTGLALQALIRSLQDKLTKPDTILICSSDFSHINGHFEHKIANNIFQNIRRIDNETLQFLYNIVDGNEPRNRSIDNILFMQNSSVCGIMAIYLFGKVLNALANSYVNGGSNSSSDSGSESSINKITNRLRNSTVNDNKYLYSRVSCYYNSITREGVNMDARFDKKTLTPLYEIKSTEKSSVSYVGLIYTKQPYIQPRKQRRIESMMTAYEELALLQLTREQLFYNLASATMTKIPTNLIRPVNAQVFGLGLGVFVTLRNHKTGALRGCIGTLETNNDEYNIESNVKKYVIEAAFRDSRFSSIEIDEFYHLDIAITILYTLQPITINQYYTGKFKLGRDGLLMKIGNKQGYFLPSVATDLELRGAIGKDKLLNELCREKVAGCDTKTAFLKNNMNNVQLFYNEGLEFHI